MEEEEIESQPKLPNFCTTRSIYIRYRRKAKKKTLFVLSVSHLEGADEKRRLGTRGVEGGGAGRKRAASDGGDRRKRAVVRSDREREPRRAIAKRRERFWDCSEGFGFFYLLREKGNEFVKRAFSVRK
jgi:hypothetical protein